MQFILNHIKVKRKKNWLLVSSFPKLGLGENVVLQLIECLPQTGSYHIFMDNYFTPFRQPTQLGVKKYRLSICTITGNYIINVVYVALNCSSFEPKRVVRRQSKVERKYMQVQQSNQLYKARQKDSEIKGNFRQQ